MFQEVFVSKRSHISNTVLTKRQLQSPVNEITFILCFTAWVSSIVLGVLCFVSPVTGAFLNRFGIRISTILGCLLCSAGLTMGSFVHNIVILYITFSIPFAMGVSVIYVTATVIATHYFDKRRSIALGIVTAGQGLGTMILGPSLQALVDVLDWRSTFRVFAGILGVTSLTGCFLHQGTSPPNGQKESPPKKLIFNLSLLKNPSVLIMLIEGGIYTFSRMVPYVHIVSIICSAFTLGPNESISFVRNRL